MRALIALVFVFPVLAPLWAHAEPIQLASNDQGKRFFALNRGPVVSVPVKVKRESIASRGSGLHSDTHAMNKGFMRLDRTMLVVNRVKPRQPVSVPAAASQDVGLLRPEGATLSNDPILDLFGADSSDHRAEFGVTRRGQRAASLGSYAWPLAINVQQRLTSGYGKRKDPFTGKTAFHAGIDIAAAPGTPVLAIASGRIKDVGASKRYGKFVSVQHEDGKVSWYGHLSSQMVRQGQLVRQGQALGNIGSSGRSTGPHLDLRIKDGNTFLNPEALLAKAAPRSMHLAQASVTR